MPIGIPKYTKPITPGEVLKEEFLIPMGLTQEQFVKKLGKTWTQAKVSAIIRGKRAITEDIALDFSEVFGASPEFWLGMQMDVNLWEAKQRRKKAVDKSPK